MNEIFDYIVIGSGFGGSVSAFRLSEKGYKVCVLEKGKRFRAEDFAETNWQVTKYLWAPLLKCFGPQKITLFKDVFILSGAGVGGGSLIYANTLMIPKPAFFKDQAWANLNNWEDTLMPHYQTAKKMLGAARNPLASEGDEVLRKLGEKLECSETYERVEVAVHFGEPEKEVADPYFDGRGPSRVGCRFCGGCMVGCRYNSKNTLDKNYLYLAEKLGAKVVAETEVVRVRQETDGSYSLETKTPMSWFGGNKKTYRAKKVVFAGGVLGSVKLLLENKHIHGTLPKISNQLGRVVRTNGESLVGATSLRTDVDFTKGIAIGAAIRPDHETKIEVVRYPKGSDFMRLISAPLTGPGNRLTRPLKGIWEILSNLPKVIRLWRVKDWARNTIILLVMQSTDNQIAFGIKRKWFQFFRKSFGAVPSGLPRIPAYIAVADKAARTTADLIHGVAQSAFSEVLMDAPATAHILGGAKMGATENDGVVDKYCRIFNYPDLYVVDGSIIPANLGVNPSLTITALAEYAMSQIPAKS